MTGFTKPKLLIFDLDGTLVDSRLDITTAFNVALANTGLPPVEESRIAPHIGTGVRVLLAEIALAHGQADPSGVYAAFDQAYMACLLDETRLYPGMDAVLKAYASTAKVVLTNKHQRFVTPILQGLGLAPYFRHAFGRDAFAKMKPDPLPVLRSCAAVGVEPAEALMIGDTPTDICAAQAAGVRSCAVLYGYGKAAELRQLSPDFIVDQPWQLLNLFPEITEIA